MSTGRNCDNCGHYLEEFEYDEWGSWSYICASCNFRYDHSSLLLVSEQIEIFQREIEGDNEDEED